jgi:hypothetical protein
MTVNNVDASFSTNDSSPMKSADSQNYSAKISSKTRSLKKANFDMGTTWGNKYQDKVTTTEFERGSHVGDIEIFYASRNALKSMGVPLINEKYVSFPKGFADFATPPKNWEG